MPAEALSVDVSLAFPGFALEVAAEIPLNGVVALFGPSGSGKSTLLRAIAGFETPDRGRIALDGEAWFDGGSHVNVPPHRRPVGYLFQDARLFQHLDVTGNLAYADKRSARHTNISTQDVIDALSLAPLLNRRPNGLSGGERQRVALARTLLIRPKLLLLDEPLAALDHDRKAEILPYLETVTQRFAIPTVYVSHALDEIVQLAQHVIVLAGGRLQAQGPLAETFEHLDLEPYTGRFDAGVVVDVDVLDHDKRLALTHVSLDGQTLTLPMDPAHAPGAKTRLRIRARDVAIATERPSAISIRNILPATVSDIAPKPGTPFVEVAVALKSSHIHARLTLAAVEDLRLEVGAPVFALIKSVSFDRRQREPAAASG